MQRDDAAATVGIRAARDTEGGGIIEAVDYVPPVPARARRLAWLNARTLLLAGALALLAGSAFYLFGARAVRIAVEPAADSIDVAGLPRPRWGNVYLLWPGDHRVRITAAGYQAIDEVFQVGDAASQEVAFTLEKLPGRLTFAGTPAGATVFVDGIETAQVPATDVPVPAGTRRFGFRASEYLPRDLEVDVEGRGRPQTIDVALQPAWADVTLTTQPPGAEVRLGDDGERVLGTTPATVRVPMGEQLLRLKLAGHKVHELFVDAVAGQPQVLPAVTLEKADGLVRVTTAPADAAVTVGGRYRGQSPLEVALPPGQPHQLSFFKPGFRVAQRSVTSQSGSEGTLHVALAPDLGEVRVVATPADATVYVDGTARGRVGQALMLPAVPHRIAIRRDGHAAHEQTVTPRPGFVQEIAVDLPTLEQARVAALQPAVQSQAGSRLVLVSAGQFRSGASRREPGRRANETLRDVTVSRPFYLGALEVSNAEFRAFRPGHDSGDFEDADLNADRQPVVNVTWQDAALYCNWLSARDGLPPFYRVQRDTVVGHDPTSPGYRLPTEAEWMLASGAGSPGSGRFPWGDALPPPDRSGNYADRTASHLIGRVIFGYTDGHVAAAPVGTYAANGLGISDLGGNVAEWTHDFYEIPAEGPAVDPMGPEKGEYHVIKGASWMHGSVTDLRWSFRDYGSEGRNDVGFRVARDAGPAS
jgi:formylglycine-generating enzyme required for sulfatase activity